MFGAEAEVQLFWSPSRTRAERLCKCLWEAWKVEEAAEMTYTTVEEVGETEAGAATGAEVEADTTDTMKTEPLDPSNW